MKNLVKLAAAISVAAITVPGPSAAATGDIIFNGTVSDTCVINVTSTGTMVEDPTDYKTFSSRIGAGVPGIAQVMTTSSAFSLSADAPSAFDSGPASAETNTSFAAYYQTTSGPTTIGETAGASATSLNQGQHVVEIDLEALKAGTSTFEQGSYQATVVLRCE